MGNILERSDGLTIRICSAWSSELSLHLLTGDILKFQASGRPAPDTSGQVQLSQEQVETINALVQKTRLGLYPRNDNFMALDGNTTTVTIRQGKYKLEIEYWPDAPKPWRQVEKLVKLVRRIASEATGLELEE